MEEELEAIQDPSLPQIWSDSVVAALQAGRSYSEAIEAADAVVKNYAHRFMGMEESDEGDEENTGRKPH